MTEEAIVRIENVSVRYGNVQALNHFSLDIQRGEFFSLLGASGCGKTTLLRLIAGFEQPAQGRIFIKGRNMEGVAPYERPVNMMFQSYALFPHMTVEDNVAYGLKQESLPKKVVEDRVREMLALVQIETLAKRKPHQLSGGQRQRVALARALAKHPSLLLLDEPLAALDQKLREETRLELVNLQAKLGITFVVVTHDQEEAMTISTRIGLMRAGHLEQVDTPHRLYEFPTTRYSAEFIGQVNLFDAYVERQEGDYVYLRSESLNTTFVVQHTQPLSQDMKVTLALRPEKLQLTHENSSLPNRVQGIIRQIAYLGYLSIYHVELPGGLIIKCARTNVQPLADEPLAYDQAVTLGWTATAACLITQAG